MKNNSFTEFKREVLTTSLNKQHLVAATIELTNICNFRCKHCYLKGSKQNFLPTEKAKKIIDDLKSEGCLMLLLTGGEPLLHPDFSEIYIYAKRRGFIITVYTNGSILSDEHIKLFNDYKPYLIEISLYGIDVKTYHEFTDSSNAYYNVMENLSKLKSNKITFRLKTMLIKHTLPLIEQMKKIAQNYDVDFRWDSYIIPTMNGNVDVLSEHILSEADMCNAIINESDKRKLIIEKMGKKLASNEHIINPNLYICDAGKTNIFISSEGKMSLCVIAREPNYDLNSGTIKEGRKLLYHHALKKMPSNIPCYTCDKIEICRYCPSKFQLETGEIYPVKRYCNIAKQILDKIQE